MSARKFYESNRRTGRTTRMLLYATFGAIRYKKRAYIMAADRKHAEYMAVQLRHLLQQNHISYDLVHGNLLFRLIDTELGEVGGSIQFLTPGRIPAAHANTDFSLPMSAVLEDHYTVECRIKKDLEKLHRWDLEQ